MIDMNAYTVLFAVLIFAMYWVDYYAEELNMKELGTALLPQEFKGYFDEAEYNRSQEYTRMKSRVTRVRLIFDAATLFGFWVAGGFAWLDGYVRAWGYGTIGTGLCYLAIFFLISKFLSLPFDVYSTFVVEGRFGFNRTTIGTFIRDQITTLLLVLVFGGLLLWVVFALFLYAGTWAWVYAWVAIAAFMLLVSFLAPVFLVPLFMKFTPLQDGELKDKILTLAEELHFPVNGVYVVDGSRRSSKANAFFTGIGKNKRIALFDTLIEKLDLHELLAVLAHEIGHNKKGHVVLGMVLGIGTTGLSLFLLSLFLKEPTLFHAFGNVEPSVYMGFVLFAIAYSPVNKILHVMQNAFSRKCEYEADAFSAEATAPEHLITGLKRLSVDGLANLTPHPLYAVLHYNHPALLERISALRSRRNFTAEHA